MGYWKWLVIQIVKGVSNMSRQISRVIKSDNICIEYFFGLITALGSSTTMIILALALRLDTFLWVSLCAGQIILGILLISHAIYRDKKGGD